MNYVAERSRNLAIKRILSVFRTALLFAVVICGIVFFEQVNKEAFHGNATVIDGDSIRLNGREIRLFGIDAPEYKQTCRTGDNGQLFRCGQKSADRLRKLISINIIKCEGSELDKYDRLLAICWAGDVEINSKMVSDGWAVAFGAYYGQEEAAETARRGLWQGNFQSPSQWRRDARDAHESGLISSIIERFF